MTLKLVKNEQAGSKAKILDGLNPAQKDAVKTLEGPVLVVAGAGSGKTRALTHRAAYLIENGVYPGNILALTFTNKAAKEMRERIANIVSPEAANMIWSGTFHSVFSRVLRIEAEILGYTKDFSIYDMDDSLRVVKKVMESLNISTKSYSRQAIRSKISWAKNQMIDPKEFASSAESPFEIQTANIFEAYNETLLKSNAMDFDDLLINFIRLLTADKEILEKYQNRFKYILVDEYQDTNRAQYIAVKTLSKKHRNICAVGDDAQSIYRWRGADIRNILDFQKDYNDAKIIRLEQNYRSTKTILAAADGVIKRNRKQLEKTLWTENPNGDLIELIRCADDREESDKIISIIKKETENGDYDVKDFAVLYRTNAQSLALENAFRRNGISYIIVGGTSFYMRKEIKDALAYFKVLINPRDDESLERIVNEPPRGIGKTTLRRLKNYAEDKNITLQQAFGEAESVPDLQARAKKALRKFVDFIDEYSDLEGADSPSKRATEYIDKTGLLQMYQEINTSDALDRWNNIQQLLSDIAEFFRKNEKASFSDYLQQITLMTDADNKNVKGEQVKLMTLHSAKGLEFPVVVIAGLEKGLFPLAKAELDPSEEEEERRLFYVGMTRAMQKLYLTYARRRLRFGEYVYQDPSGFIDEVDRKFLKEVAKREARSVLSGNSRVRKPSKPKPFVRKAKSSNEEPPKSESESCDFAIGERVEHSKFGKGTLLATAGSGEMKKAVVNFNSVGKKVLMLKYAKLKRVE